MKRKNISWKAIIFSAFTLALTISQSTFAFTQYNYLFRFDDGGESTATDMAAENTSALLTKTDQVLRLRLGIASDDYNEAILQKAAKNISVDGSRITSAVIDGAGKYAYFGTYTSPAKVLKVDLDNFQITDTLILDEETTGTNDIENLNTAIINSNANNAYFSTATTPSKVVKIDLDDFSYADHVDLLPEVASITSAIGDKEEKYLYFGTAANQVVRIPTMDFSRFGAKVLPLAEDEKSFYSVVISPDSKKLYFGTRTSPARIITIDIANAKFEKENTYIFDEGVDNLITAVIDQDGENAYFGTDELPGKIVKVDLRLAEKEQGTLDFIEQGLGKFFTSQINYADNKAYFASHTDPASIIVLPLDNFDLNAIEIIELKDESKIHTTLLDQDGKLIFGTESLPGQIGRLQDGNDSWQFRLEYGKKSTSCTDIALWQDVFELNNWNLASSEYLVDGKSSNASGVLSDPSGNFIAGELLSKDSQTQPLQFAEGEFSEFEYSLKPANNIPSGTYCFRLSNNGNDAVFSYEKYAEITVENSSSDHTDNNQNSSTDENNSNNSENDSSNENNTTDNQNLDDKENLSDRCIHNDLPADYQYCPAIKYNYEIGTFTGDGQGNFRPEDGVLRAEASKILNVANKVDISPYDNVGKAGFTDTLSGEWYISYLKASRLSKMIYGYPTGEFKPSQTAIRAEWAAMVTRALEVDVNNACDQVYAEDIDPDTYWGPAACYLVKNDLIELQDGKFAPTADITRIDAARILFAAKETIANISTKNLGTE